MKLILHSHTGSFVLKFYDWKGKEDKKSNVIVRTLRALNTGLLKKKKVKVVSLC